MSISRKHFEAVAEIIKGNIERCSNFERFRTETIALELAFYFHSENPNFNHTKFLTACGMTKEF